MSFYSIFFAALLTFFSSSLAHSADCAGYPRVTGYTSEIADSCLGLAFEAKDVPWVMPREIVFLNAETILVSDLGGWGSPKAGGVWSINIESGAYQKIYSGGHLTHGLDFDSQGRLLVGDANQILRLTKGTPEVVIGNLSVEGSHPLSQFITLPNDDLVLNVGAPSDNCQKEMRGGTHCPSRDQEGEIRLYSYLRNSDTYDSEYRVLGRGLRNSMALLFNPNVKSIYQGENNIDNKGTPEEFNVIPLYNETIMDFGWPFCYGMDSESPGLKGSFVSFCRSDRTQAPLFIIPNHSSPLDMLYYESNAFSEIENTILMGWHGHRRENEAALVAYDVNLNLEPLVDSVKSNPFLTVLSGINPVSGEKIRPVGVTTNQKGEIWFVDDKTKRVYVFASSQQSDADLGPSGLSFVDKNQDLVSSLTELQMKSFNDFYDSFMSVQTCTKCHDSSSFPKESKEALLVFLNKRWILPGMDSSNMPLIERMNPLLASPRSMPPPPERPFGETHPSLYQDLTKWINQNL